MRCFDGITKRLFSNPSRSLDEARTGPRHAKTTFHAPTSDHLIPSRHPGGISSEIWDQLSVWKYKIYQERFYEHVCDVLLAPNLQNLEHGRASNSIKHYLLSHSKPSTPSPYSPPARSLCHRRIRLQKSLDSLLHPPYVTQVVALPLPCVRNLLVIKFSMCARCRLHRRNLNARCTQRSSPNELYDLPELRRRVECNLRHRQSKIFCECLSVSRTMSRLEEGYASLLAGVAFHLGAAEVALISRVDLKGVVLPLIHQGTTKLRRKAIMPQTRDHLPSVGSMTPARAKSPTRLLETIITPVSCGFVYSKWLDVCILFIKYTLSKKSRGISSFQSSSSSKPESCKYMLR